MDNHAAIFLTLRDNLKNYSELKAELIDKRKCLDTAKLQLERAALTLYEEVYSILSEDELKDESLEKLDEQVANFLKNEQDCRLLEAAIEEGKAKIKKCLRQEVLLRLKTIAKADEVTGIKSSRDGGKAGVIWDDSHGISPCEERKHKKDDADGAWIIEG